MKVKELIKALKDLGQEKNIVVSSDEELNTIYKDFEICELEGENRYCIFGLSGSEDY
jgi:N-acetylglutamate synthase-like GNAT family acetyltransferase